MIPNDANVNTNGLKYSHADGSNGTLKRMKPYAPNLIKIPASNTDPPTGASTCANGNQIWKGNFGILTANLAKKHRKIITSDSNEKL